MLRKTLSILTLALLAVGCQEGGSRIGEDDGGSVSIDAAVRGEHPTYVQTFSFDDGYVGVLNDQIDRQSHQLSLRFDCRRIGYPQSRYEIRLGATDSDTSERIVIEQYDGNSQLTFGIAMEVDNSDPNWARVTEYTRDDVLQLTRTVRPDSVTESYVVKDSSFSLSFSRSLYDQLRSGEFQSNDSLASEYQAVLSEMALLYPGDGSLSPNASGNLLVEILTNRDFLNWVARSQSELIGQPLSKTEVTLEEICAIAWMCSMLKCPIGVWANPLCHACVGVDLACSLAGALKVLHDWIS